MPLCLDQLTDRIRTVIGLNAATTSVSVTLNTGTLTPSAVSCAGSIAAQHLHLTCQYGSGIEEHLDISWNDSAPAIRCEREVRNTGPHAIELVELGFHITGVTLPGARHDDYFYHVENPRIYGVYAIPVRLTRSTLVAKESEFDVLGGSKWADPGTVTERIGASVYQPFPAVLIANTTTETGFVHGTLSQDVFYHNYRIEHAGDAIVWDIHSSSKAVRSRTWRPGETLRDAWYLGRTGHAGDITRIFDGYTAALRVALPVNRGATNVNRHHVLWGSWNDGHNADIDEARILDVTEHLKAHYPTVRWVQIDDGYATRTHKGGFAHGLGSLFEDDGVDPAKFPNGMAHTADGIRERGLEAALWVGLIIPNRTPLGMEHPEWMCDYTYRLTTCKPLDISIPEVQEWMIGAMRQALVTWRFRALKMDFWSYVFEDSHPILRNTDRTGFEWRRWFLHQILEMLPRDTYLQTGCDTCEGNPFLGEWFSNYRYGIDIGSGNWDHVRTSMQWGTACFATHTGDLFIPNSDSIGLLPKLSDDEALTTITYCLISRSLVEIAGWLHKQPDHPRAAWVKKAICCPNNGENVYFANFDYRAPDAGIPPVWYLKTPHFARTEGFAGLPLRTVALFNTTDAGQTLSLDPMALGLPAGRYTATDVWSLATQPIGPDLRTPVTARGSRLFCISPDDGALRVLDANVGIAATRQMDGALELDVMYGGAVTLVLSARPTGSILFNGKCLDATITAGAGNVILKADVPGSGTLRLQGA